MTNATQQQQTAHAALPSTPAELAELVRSQGILVSLEITTWSGRRLDKRATADTTQRAGAGADAGRFNKHLLGGRVASFDAALAAGQAARAVHYHETLPWSDSGPRLLPTANYEHYSKRIREARDRFRAAVQTFLDEYPELCQRAAERLGSLYDPADYPPASEIASRFRFRVVFDPVPAGSDIRLSLPPAVTERMAHGIDARVTMTVRNAVADGWQRLGEQVERVRDRLTEIADSGGRLHAAIFEGARDTAQTLRRLNVLQDPQLDAIAQQVEEQLGQLDPKQLRKEGDDALRAAAAEADAILSSMAGLYGGAS